jgi:hypothetical protein
MNKAFIILFTSLVCVAADIHAWVTPLGTELNGTEPGGFWGKIGMTGTEKTELGEVTVVTVGRAFGPAHLRLFNYGLYSLEIPSHLLLNHYVALRLQVYVAPISQLEIDVFNEMAGTHFTMGQRPYWFVVHPPGQPEAMVLLAYSVPLIIIG